MRRLRAADITRLVEWGEGKHALDRAQVLLRLAHARASREELLQLPIGARDRLLLEIRRSLFGSRLDLIVRCGACRLNLEFRMTVEELLATPAPTSLMHQLEHDGYELAFRLPDATDLAAVVAVEEVGAARRLLLRRCIASARRSGLEVSPEELPAHVLDALSRCMGDIDPLADISFKLQCEACRREIEASFDVLHFLWTELEAHAKRVQHEIHLLARAYGWSEQVILDMTPARRHRYCQMISDG